MKKIWFFVVISAIFIGFGACNRSSVGTDGDIQLDTANKLFGEWQWILTENADSGELVPADKKTILKMSIADTVISDDQEFAIAYEVFVEDTLFRKGISPIFKKTSVLIAGTSILTKRSFIYLPCVEMRSCDIQFMSHNKQPSLDTLCFIGSSYKVYYSRIR